MIMCCVKFGFGYLIAQDVLSRVHYHIDNKIDMTRRMLEIVAYWKSNN